jgi:hypothetical protein
MKGVENEEEDEEEKTKTRELLVCAHQLSLKPEASGWSCVSGTQVKVPGVGNTTVLARAPAIKRARQMRMRVAIVPRTTSVGGSVRKDKENK